MEALYETTSDAEASDEDETAGGRDQASPIVKDAPYPKKLTIVLTDRCNLKCFICQRDEYEQALGGFGQLLDLNNLSHLDEAIKAAEIIDITGFGESFLHPELKGFLDYIYALNPNPGLIAGISNGTALSREKGELMRGHLAYLWISLNAANAKAYRRDMHPESNSTDFRGRRDPRVRFMTDAEAGKFLEHESLKKHGSFERVLDNIREFMSGVDEEERERVHLHYVVHRRNYHEMRDFVILAKELGVSQVNFNQYMVTKPESIDDSIWWVKEQYNAALDLAKTAGEELGVKVIGRHFFEEKERLYNKEIDCQSPSTEALVGADGTVNPCCQIGAGGVMGNAYDKGFDAVWHGDDYRRLRKERYKPGCLNCNLFLTYDDYRSHFHPHIKSTDQWKGIAARFAKPSDTPALQVLIIGTGRDGSKSLSRLIEELYKQNGQPAIVRHEVNGFGLHDRVLDCLKQDDRVRLPDLFTAEGPHVHAGGPLVFVLPALREVLGPEVKVIHLKRDRDACIRSLRSRVELYPELWGGYADPMAAGDGGTPLRLEVMRPTAAAVGDMDQEDWERLTLEEMLGWYYDAAHAHAEKYLDLFPSHLSIATESLDSPATARRIAAFVNPEWRQVPAPIHIQFSRFFDGSEVRLSDRNRRDIETMLNEFDLHKAIASPGYPVIYFLAWLVSVHNKTPEGMADLPIKLRHVRSHIDLLLKLANEGGGNGFVTTNGNGREAAKFDLRGMSDEQRGKLQRLLRDFDPREIYKTDTYPLVHFLDCLPSVHANGSAGAPGQFIPLYQWIGETIDGLLKETAQAAH